MPLNDQSKEFMSVFTDIVQDLKEEGNHLGLSEVSEWLSKVLRYNVLGGKYNRGLTLVTTYKMLQNPDNLTLENIKLANIMGWCLEMFQAYLVVLDDIMDNSSIRRCMPCWYTLDNIGLNAINDAILIHSSIYFLLKKYFHEKPYYLNVLEAFNEVLRMTSIGQFLDTQTSKGTKPDLSKFTMKRYKAIVKYKASYYTILMPVNLAMWMSGINDSDIHNQANTVLLEIGEFFQIQDDYLDSFGDPAVTGKIGTDIKEGKCSWLAVIALQKLNTIQIKIFEQFYGTKNDSDAEKIKKLYEELGLSIIYAAYEKETYNLIRKQIQKIPKELPHAIFLNILDTLYLRKR